MFIGRVNRSKGVFDILEIAQTVEAREPGQVCWEICGSGPDLEELKRRCGEMGLESIVNIRGWTSLSDLIEVYVRSHAAIVPTRSSFIAGLEMTAAEAILAGARSSPTRSSQPWKYSGQLAWKPELMTWTAMSRECSS